MLTNVHCGSFSGHNPGERRTLVNFPATVTEIWDMTPTIKSLNLSVSNHQQLDYKAGQWLEFKIPGLQRMGSFTMCTSPLKFKKTGVIQLAVKYSDHAPTLWVHTKCDVGRQITFSFGGDFHYNPGSEDPKHDILLIGGGIGVNPLFCMMNLMADYNEMIKGGNSSCYQPGKVQLLYSVRTEEEIQFKNDLEDLQNKNENFKLQFFVTQKPPNNENIIYRRINKDDIEEALRKLDRDNCYIYICAPPDMMDDMEDILENIQFDDNKVRIGRWW